MLVRFQIFIFYIIGNNGVSFEKSICRLVKFRENVLDIVHNSTDFVGKKQLFIVVKFQIFIFVIIRNSGSLENFIYRYSVSYLEQDVQSNTDLFSRKIINLRFQIFVFYIISIWGISLENFICRLLKLSQKNIECSIYLDIVCIIWNTK